MQHDFELFLSIAEIAGVFVGFGALIALTHAAEVERGDLIRLGAVVTVGVYAIVGALIPVALGRYGLASGALWKWSSGMFLLVIWLVILALMRLSGIRAFLREEAKTRPVFAFVFWAFLELPIHVVLFLVLLGVAPSRAPAFYTTALVLTLLEGALALSQLVYLRLLRA